MNHTWERPKTTRVYLHAPCANRLILAYPDFKVTDLDLKNNGRHTRQSGFGVHLLLNGTSPDFHQTVFDPVKGGYPVYSMRNGSLGMTVFSLPDEHPVTYAKVTICALDACESGNLGLMMRYAIHADQYLTGLWDTGYESYAPNEKQWFLLPHVEHSGLSVHGKIGKAEIIQSRNFSVKWVSRKDQPKRFEASEFFECSYSLKKGESAELVFVMCADNIEKIFPYDEAKKKFDLFWNSTVNKMQGIPDTKDDAVKELYKHSITQCLQMLARYDESDDICVRQGDVGRYIWVWEAVHVLEALDLAGFFAYTHKAYKAFAKQVDLKENRGCMNCGPVHWNNSEGALLLGLALHLLFTESKEEFDTFKPVTDALITYIETMRNSAEAGIRGLFPVGRSSDWGEAGQFWIYTDAFQVNALEKAREAYAFFGADVVELNRICTSYRKNVETVYDALYKGHENDVAFIFPHIAGIPFEESFNHCFTTDGAAMLPCFGFMDPCSRQFEQMEAYYREAGLFEHGLCARLTNAADPGIGAYGDCYYTGPAELQWLFAWIKRGEKEKALVTHKALLKYNVTSEYIVSERYCSFDPYYTPWQPNGSGSARIAWYLNKYIQEIEKT